MSRKRFIQVAALAAALELSACARSPLEPRAGYCSWGLSAAETGCLEWVPETQPDTLFWEAEALTSPPSSSGQGSVDAIDGAQRPNHE